MTHPPRPRPDPLWAAVEVDQYSAQALERARPDLRGTAFVVVHQSSDNHRAAVQAVSPHARSLQVEPGTPVFVMRRHHSGRINVVDRDESAETAAAEALSAHVEQWTPSFRVRHGWARLSALLDLRGTPMARAHGWRDAGAELQRQLVQATGLGQVAVGVSASRLVARTLAREALPHGVGLCAPGEEAEVLARTELAGLPGLGTQCRERAAQYGIFTAEQVLSLDRQSLRRRFGRKAGERLYGAVRGLEGEASSGSPGNLEAQTVLREDANDDALLREAVALTVDRACHKLRQQRLTARSLTLRVTYTDNRRVQRTARLASTTDDFGTLRAAAQDLFRELHMRRVAVQSIAVSPARTCPTTGQHDLFDDESRRRGQRLGTAITDIRRRMGFDAVLGGGALEVTGQQ